MCSQSRESLSGLVEEWSRRQWHRYDMLVASFTRHDDELSKKALCLAFVRSVLDDKTTEKLLTDLFFEATGNVVSECERAIGKENVSTAKAQLLLMLWLLPHRQWQETVFKTMRDYCSRDIGHPLIPFRRFFSSTLRTIARKIADPLADVIERWL